MAQALNWDGKDPLNIPAVREAHIIQQKFEKKISEWESMGVCIKVAEIFKRFDVATGRCAVGQDPCELSFGQAFRALERRMQAVQDWERDQTDKITKEKLSVSSSGEGNSRVILIGIDNFSERDEKYARELRMFIGRKKAIIPIILTGQLFFSYSVVCHINSGHFFVVVNLSYFIIASSRKHAQFQDSKVLVMRLT
jgi:hypothetical protein